MLSKQFRRHPKNRRLAMTVARQAGKRHVFLRRIFIPSTHANVANIAVIVDLRLKSLPGFFYDWYKNIGIQNATFYPRNHRVGKHRGA